MSQDSESPDNATLSRLLDTVLDLPEGERASWVESLPEEHAALKPRLRALLARAARIETSDFLQTLPKLESAPSSNAGEIVGPYRLIREIGAGGMGSVWLAERTDGMVKRPIALKLPHFASRRVGLEERMAREREILATFTHPNIARLYDAGVTTEGRPYLALEYVDGTPIDVYCEKHSLDVPARLRLFLQVANALAHAHAKLVIHRDLKPANILVTADGEVRLLDFGVAKLLGDSLFTNATRLTEVAGRAITPEYASPEQILGEPLTIATDVYSLGVVLYELLAGQRPYRLKRPSVGALEEAILQSSPPKPSDIAPASLRRALRGDLDTIVLKALSKAPEDRYATVNAFADDVVRHLEKRPILARPESFWYRTGRFVARRKLAVSLASVALAGIVGGAVIAFWQAQEANAQRDAAVAQQQRAEAFSEFMSLLLQDAGERPSTAPELLRRGTEMLERQDGVDELLAAHMYYEISRNYLFFNDTENERALLERSAELARRKGDMSLQAAAQCSVAWALSNRDREAAERMLAEGLKALEGASTRSAHAIADCQRARSRLLHARGDAEGAIAAALEGLAEFDRQGVKSWTRKSLLATQLTDVYRSLDRYQDALPYTEEDLRVVRQSGRTGTLSEIVAMNNHMGNLMRVGEISAAAALASEIVDRLGQSTLPVQPVGLRANVGNVIWRLGDAAKALALAEEDRVIAERAGNAVSVSLADLLAARALLSLGRRDESRERIERAEAVWNSDARMFARMLQEAALHRIEMHLAHGEIEQAARLADSTLASAGYPGTIGPGVDRVLRSGSRAHRLAGDPQRAAELAAAALKYSASLARGERQSADVGLAALLHAEALVELGQVDRAVQDAALAEEALRAGMGAEHADTLAAAALRARLSR